MSYISKKEANALWHAVRHMREAVHAHERGDMELAGVQRLPHYRNAN